MFNEHEISLLRVAVRVEKMLQDGVGRRPENLEKLKLFAKYVLGKFRHARRQKLEIAIHPLLISAVLEVTFARAHNRDPYISAITAYDRRAVGVLGYSARLPPQSSPSEVLDAALAALSAGSSKPAAQSAGRAELPAAPVVDNNIPAEARPFKQLARRSGAGAVLQNSWRGRSGVGVIPRVLSNRWHAGCRGSGAEVIIWSTDARWRSSCAASGQSADI
ncbi:hypothetical protein FA95DRAFT_1612039 [Auriscalpium vulgare]|uniref:Uncharacterized protein n=1 Tax=Auriscalpium vulgare TaxID=40419 RepID=A0ACB8R891_9AGAM|nr:hypothetical protein FA95DRAFT_1612039 [Auriscalpium vulgare]